jgi:hypothetical protein
VRRFAGRNGDEGNKRENRAAKPPGGAGKSGAGDSPDPSALSSAYGNRCTRSPTNPACDAYQALPDAASDSGLGLGSHSDNFSSACSPVIPRHTGSESDRLLPGRIGSASRFTPQDDFSRTFVSRLQIFRDVLASNFVHPPDRPYRRAYCRIVLSYAVTPCAHSQWQDLKQNSLKRTSERRWLWPHENWERTYCFLY